MEYSNVLAEIVERAAIEVAALNALSRAFDLAVEVHGAEAVAKAIHTEIPQHS